MVNGVFTTLRHAQECLDTLACQTVRLMRMVEHHRLGIGPELQPLESATSQQKVLEQDLEAWQAAFCGLRRNLKSRTKQEFRLLLLEMRWLVARIWTSTCLSKDERIYDQYLASFIRIIELASQVKVQTALSGTVRGAFSFGMGFSPLLHFVVLKCRFLEIRLAAQSLMMALSCSRESLWDSATMHAIGTKVIEIEHGITLSMDPSTPQIPQGDGHVFPGDEKRIRDNALEPDIECCTDNHGTEFWRRKIRLLIKPGIGPIESVYDWVTIV
jgi:hypothetical protein